MFVIPQAHCMPLTAGPGAIAMWTAARINKIGRSAMNLTIRHSSADDATRKGGK